jgi:hypothetical protein
MRRPVALVLLFVFTSIFTFAQDKTPKQVQDTQTLEREHHEHNDRQAWFRNGRTSPNTSVSAAEMLHRAQQQRQALRVLRQQQTAARSTARAGATQAVTAATANWQLLGPSPMVSSDDPGNLQDYGNVSGRVTSVAFDQSDATGNTVYMAGAYGGVWKSTNAAGPAASVTWTPLTDDQPTLSVGAIALSPDGNTLLIGTGEPDNAIDSYYGLGILRSTNAKAVTPAFTHISSTAEALSFRGVGFSRFAWNTNTPTNVVASAANTSKNEGSLILPATGSNTNVGLFFSNDSGATWHKGTVTDGGAAVTFNSATSVVFNDKANGGAGAYFATIRTHGVFVSTDNGQTWTKTTAQPVAAVASVFRGSLAATPGRNELFAWFVDPNDANLSVWVTRDAGATWTDLGSGGQMTSCGDFLGGPAGCGTDQGFYNLELSAVPNGSGTDLYAGAINIFKCSMAANSTAACNWLNTTHVYGCTPLSNLAHVHPDQHSIDFLRSTPDRMVFGNDGGVYRSLDASTGIATGTCGQKNSYENLNTNLALTQFVWFSQDPTADQTLLGGTQDNGTPSLNPAVANAGNPKLWTNYLAGDGGYTAIDPNNPSNWFMSQPGAGDASSDISSSPLGVNARGAIAGPVVTSFTLGSDTGAFYTPYLLDPAVTTKMLVGTCRVWRVGTNGVGATALSNNFTENLGARCTAADANIRALAAGGPSNASGSQVIYAGTESGNAARSASIFVTENAAGGPATWTDRTNGINPLGYQISSILVDKNDATGKTAFVTIMGFSNGVPAAGHVFRTTNAGVTWSNVTGDLPDAPADSFALDPGDRNIWYVATDVGVYVSTNNGVNWTEYGPASGAGALPNVAITHLETINTANVHQLRVSTYGRGIWQAELLSGGIPVADFSVSPTGPATQTIAKGATATYTIGVSGVNGFTGAVTFSCSAGLPAGTACAFAPASATPGGSTTLSIQTVAAGSNQPATLATLSGWWSLGCLVPGMLLIGFGRRKRGVVLTLSLLVAALLTMPGCGGGGGSSTPTPTRTVNPGTTAGTYVVTVSAVSGSITHTTQVTLTVQ